MKLIGVLAMTAAIFPAYGLARLVVSRPYALFAAVGAVAAPALAYAPFLVDEPLAYPVSTLALAADRARRQPDVLGVVGLALAACVLGVLVRTQLAILLPVLGLVLFVRALADRAASQLARDVDDVGLGRSGRVLLVGVAVVLSALIGHRSATWYVGDRLLQVTACSSTESGRWAR